eukprot:scaffold5539_cov81-Skeletonema_menzelii.AAC.5
MHVMKSNLEESRRRREARQQQKKQQHESDKQLMAATSPGHLPPEPEPEPTVIIEEEDDDDNNYIEPPFETTCPQNNSVANNDTTIASTGGDHPSSSSAADDDGIETLSPLVAIAPIKEKQHQQPIMATPVTPPKTPKEEVTSSSATITPSSASSPLHAHDMVPILDASITSSITDSKSELSTIQKAYYEFKRTKHQRSTCFSEGSNLHDIIEGVQFCTMYVMNELFDNYEDEVEDEYDHYENRMSKGERMKETNQSFLGKIIQCGTTLDNHCHHCGDDDDDDLSGELPDDSLRVR